MSGNGHSCHARSIPQQRLVERTHLYGHHRLYLHILLSYPREISVRVVQETSTSASELPRKHETCTRTGTWRSPMDCTISRAYHWRISHHLSIGSLHLLHRVRCKKSSSSELNYSAAWRSHLINWRCFRYWRLTILRCIWRLWCFSCSFPCLPSIVSGISKS